MNFRILAAGAAGALALLSAGAADAALVFVGSWKVNSGVDATPRSALQAAAQLFGGAPTDYVISTAGSNVANIDFQAVYALIGAGPGDVGFAPADVTSAYGFEASAYIGGSAVEDRWVNYAFADRVDPGPGIPEPGTWALMIGGFGLAGAALRRRRAFA